MISIPVSFLLSVAFAALAVFAFAQKALPRMARCLFSGLLIVMALEASLVGIRFAFGVLDLLWLQRSLPVVIAPLAYLSFLGLCECSSIIRLKLANHGCAALVLSAAMLLPLPLAGLPDFIIAGSFAFYALALGRLWRQGPDVFAQVPTRLIRHLRGLLVAAIAVMTATIMIDATVAMLFAQDRPEMAAAAISYASLLLLVSGLFLGVIFMKTGSSSRESTGNGTAQEDGELVIRAREVLHENGLYRDPDLSLTRLARRVGVPDRDLSRAVNRNEGVSVTQFINNLRLEEAARLLQESDDPVAKIQEQAGFLTRSNFYKEFQRRFGQSPGAFRKTK